MPTEALLRSAAALRAAHQVPGAREAVTGELDTAAVLRRRDDLASLWNDDGQMSWLDDAGITLPHFPDGLTPTAEILAGLDDLIRAGKIRHGGLSNFPAWRVAGGAAHTRG